MWRWVGISSFLLVSFAAPFQYAVAADDWSKELQREITIIDAETSGEMGVYVKSLSDGLVLNYHGERSWYLASAIKVLVAVVLLQKVESKQLSLEDKVVLRRDDYVDGGGDLLRTSPGTTLSLRQLLEKMLVQSDSTAADMLIRKIGEAELNSAIKKIAPSGFSPITTLLQVRRDAYGMLHPRAKQLKNQDFIELKRIKDPKKRLDSFATKIRVARTQLRLGTIDEAFERYYLKGLNSATLASFASVLQRLFEGRLLSPAHSALQLDLMQKMTTGENRLKAGLPKGIRFSQKTGTQVRRMCNVGIARPIEEASSAVIITACLEKYDNQAGAELTLQRIGQAITRSGVFVFSRR